MRILVVEDERKVASFIRRGLQEEGHAVEVAPDGTTALDLALAEPPYDLVVLDLMLPQRDGFSVRRTLRQERVGTPVLILTARETVADKVTVIPNAVDADAFAFRAQPDDYLLFLGRFTEGKGVLQAIDLARRVGMRLLLAAAEEPYYRDHVAPHVDGRQIVYVGEVDFDGKVALYGGARALLYPVQAAEPFGLVMAEAMACGTPVAALDLGAVREVLDEGITGYLFDSAKVSENPANPIPSVPGPSCVPTATNSCLKSRIHSLCITVTWVFSMEASPAGFQ